MIVLDTNVISALMRRVADRQVIQWLDKQPRFSIWITSITLLEIRFGLQVLPLGKRRAALVQAFEEILANKIDNRVAPFDATAADQSAGLMAARHKRGRPGELRDTMIAGIVLVNHATLATRNVLHFQDAPIPIVNPWLS